MLEPCQDVDSTHIPTHIPSVLYYRVVHNNGTIGVMLYNKIINLHKLIALAHEIQWNPTKMDTIGKVT